MDPWIAAVVTIIGAATPLLYAALGELVAERSGVLNLGDEGMMLVGAVTGFAVTATTVTAWLGIPAAALAGTLMALLFAVLTLTLLANQVATGLALTIFGFSLVGASVEVLADPVRRGRMAGEIRDRRSRKAVAAASGRA